MLRATLPLALFLTALVAVRTILAVRCIIHAIMPRPTAPPTLRVERCCALGWVFIRTAVPPCHAKLSHHVYSPANPASQDPAAEAYLTGDKNELSEALEGLGVDAQGNTQGMDAYIQSTIKAAMQKAEKERLMEENDDYIPMPDPPVGMNTYSEASMDEDDDEVPLPTLPPRETMTLAPSHSSLA